MTSFSHPYDALRALPWVSRGLVLLQSHGATVRQDFLAKLQPLYVTTDLMRYALGMLASLPTDFTYEDLQDVEHPLEHPLYIFQEPVDTTGKLIKSTDSRFPEQEGDACSGLLHAVTPITFKGFPAWLTLISEQTTAGEMVDGVGVYMPVAAYRHNFVADQASKGESLPELLPWAVCLLLQQQQRLVTNVEAPWPSRQAQRAAIRKNFPPVRVIDLRTPQRATPTGESTVVWSHRWVVRGHWRRQWYPKRQRHSLIWIDPHIKGPEDAPLDLRPTVWQADVKHG